METQHHPQQMSVGKGQFLQVSFYRPESVTILVPVLHIGILFLHPSAMLMLSSYIRQQYVGKI